MTAFSGQRAIPHSDRGCVSIIAENAQCARIQQEMLPGAGGQSNPTRCENPQHMAVGEQRDIALCCTRSRDHPVHPHTHLVRRLPTWAAIAENQPSGPAVVDLLWRQSFVLAVIPFA